MLLQNRLNQRIAETIKQTIESERQEADTSTASWRQRCEVAQVATYGDAERNTFIHHVTEKRGHDAASEIFSEAAKLRTTAIFILKRSLS
jgi:phage baseplate assembly protein W